MIAPNLKPHSLIILILQQGANPRSCCLIDHRVQAPDCCCHRSEEVVGCCPQQVWSFDRQEAEAGSLLVLVTDSDLREVVTDRLTGLNSDLLEVGLVVRQLENGYDVHFKTVTDRKVVCKFGYVMKFSSSFCVRMKNRAMLLEKMFN
jgi:hypothetical protein